MPRNWPNQMLPVRVQAPGIQDDFLLQMLQVNCFNRFKIFAHSLNSLVLFGLSF